MTIAQLDEATEHAWQSRDVHFDGRFFVGVVTTGIFCRTLCHVRRPNPENVGFFENAAAALASGFRRCLRCQPELDPGTAWRRSAGIVSDALHLIESSPSDHQSVSSLADALSVSRRYLVRVFQQELETSVQLVLQAQRLMIARQLLDRTTLTVTEVAMAAGYGSVRRFNAHCLSVYDLSPTALRNAPVGKQGEIEPAIPYREPHDF